MRPEQLRDPEPTRPRLGVSGCLLGQKVRFDGQHKRARFLVETLAPYVDFRAFCPEVEAGFGVPRPTIRFEIRDGVTRAVRTKDGADITPELEAASERILAGLTAAGLDGLVLKKDSPSCGMQRVKKYRPGGMPEKDGVGVFAAAARVALPELPFEEEGRLNDPGLRYRFLTHIFARARARGLFEGRWTRGQVVAFHSREKYLLMAHSPVGYKRLGQLVAAIKTKGRDEFAAEYLEGFARALSAAPSRGRHVNVMQHLAGYFRDHLPAAERAELAAIITAYGAGEALLLEPLTLLRHYIRRHDDGYLARQTYLTPYPAALLRKNPERGVLAA